MMEQRLMTEAQAAEYLNVPKRALGALAEEGSIPPPVKMRRLKRWDRRAIDFFLDKKAGINGPTDKVSVADREQAELLRRAEEW